MPPKTVPSNLIVKGVSFFSATTSTVAEPSCQCYSLETATSPAMPSRLHSSSRGGPVLCHLVPLEVTWQSTRPAVSHSPPTHKASTTALPAPLPCHFCLRYLTCGVSDCQHLNGFWNPNCKRFWAIEFVGFQPPQYVRAH